MAVSRKLVAAGYGAFSLQGASGLSSFVIVIESMLWAGAFKSRRDEPYFMSPLDFCRAVKSGKLVKTGPRTRAAWQLIKAFTQYWAKDALNASDFRSFSTGKTAMWYTGSWAAGELQGAIKKTFELDLFPIPPVTKASSPLAIGDTYSGIGVMASGHPYGIPTASERNGNIKLAVDFLQFYSQPALLTPLALGGAELPDVVGSETVPLLFRRVVEEVIPRQSLLGPVYFDLNTELTTKEGQLSQGYLSGAISLDTALSQMEQLHHQVADAALASVGLS
jgi:ABC-type glycerol-3-phosphate transport system substrate-binding protein